ncbi:Cytochrome P450 [Pleurostoma richardsiae]|uniref:Cytochrome P450 n=1 Tax=Pleurostoma richardsiae TaxID=41990 RepID=A0AA38VRV1_9PEZI|nr:Cytochrome P450 [Pleurostoma richardsiae]
MPARTIPSKDFFLLGEDFSVTKPVDVDTSLVLNELKKRVAAQFTIVDHNGIDFFSVDEDNLPDVSDVIAHDGPVGITVDGHKVRQIPGPKGLPIVGDYYGIFPDHLGNHQRLFDQYGSLIRTECMGKVVYQTNDPNLATIVMRESEYFTKEITEDHPLAGLKMQEAGVFLGDTEGPAWRIVHKFLPPALGPKAVRHYAPTMQKSIEYALPVFDEMDRRGEAFNVYQYMLKLGSQAVGKLVLGMDFKQFETPESPLHELVLRLAEVLALNKKVCSRGRWYASLPFGDPAKLRYSFDRIHTMIGESVKIAQQGGVKDLELQDAALEASNMVDYCIRATDSKGEKLPKENMTPALLVATGAGFTTTSSLLSWLVYCMVVYPGVQDRLLQELVDNNFSEDMEITPEFTAKLAFQDKVIKECQRRHNPSYQPGRTAKKDMILPGGYKLNKGGVVVAAIHHISNNPALWDNPTRFDPDRWDTDEVKNMPKAQYQPFGMGQRMCIGFNFALQEIKIFLPKLVWRYKFVKETDAVVEYDPMFQLIRPNNLYVRAHRRVKWPPKSETASA